METSQATIQLKGIRKKYLWNFIFHVLILYSLVIIVGCLYILPIYNNVFWKDFFLEKLSFLYSNNELIQTIIVVVLCSILSIVLIVLTSIIYYKNNSKYGERFMGLLYDELRLNEIYIQNKRRLDESNDLELICKSYNLKNVERTHLFTFKSLLEMDFYQFYSFMHRRKDYSLLIKSRVNKGLNGYLTLQFDNQYTIEEYNEKGIFQYNFQDTRKYPYDIYANSSFGRDTYQIVNENVLKTMISLKEFTGVNIRVTLEDHLYFVLINGWELKLSDNLFAPIAYNTMDKKVELFTELLDEIVDLYSYLVN